MGTSIHTFSIKIESSTDVPTNNNNNRPNDDNDDNADCFSRQDKQPVLPQDIPNNLPNLPLV